MSNNMLLYLILLLLSPALSIKLQVQRLKTREYPKAVCNDGTPAVYYIQQKKIQKIQKLFIYLDGSGFCTDKEDCIFRCRLLDSFDHLNKHKWLCTSEGHNWETKDYIFCPIIHRDVYPMYQKVAGIWSENQKENPPFFDYFKAAFLMT